MQKNFCILELFNTLRSKGGFFMADQEKTESVLDNQPSTDQSGAENAPAPRQFVERRRRPDWVMRSVTVVALIGWTGPIIAFILLERARPEGAGLFSGLFDITILNPWNSSLLRWAFVSIVSSLIITSIGMFINTKRKRRKTDRFNRLLIILGAFSIVFIVFFLANYARYMHM